MLELNPLRYRLERRHLVQLEGVLSVIDILERLTFHASVVRFADAWPRNDWL